MFRVQGFLDEMPVFSWNNQPSTHLHHFQSDSSSVRFRNAFARQIILYLYSFKKIKKNNICLRVYATCYELSTPSVANTIVVCISCFSISGLATAANSALSAMPLFIISLARSTSA